MTSVACSYRDSHLFSLYEISRVLKLFYPELTAFISVHTCVFAGEIAHGSVFVDALQHFQIVSLTDLKVVRVVSRRDLNSACSLFRIRIRVSDYRDLTSNDRKDDFMTYNVLVSLVIT